MTYLAVAHPQLPNLSHLLPCLLSGPNLKLLWLREPPAWHRLSFIHVRPSGCDGISGKWEVTDAPRCGAALNQGLKRTRQCTQMYVKAPRRYYTKYTRKEAYAISSLALRRALYIIAI